MGALFAIWRASMQELAARPRALFLDVVFMIMNNLAWVILWVFIFDKTGPIRGWDIDRYYLFFSVVAMAYGISFGLFNNARRISRLILDGDLDVALTLPVDTLAYLLVRRVDAANIGDIVFALGVFLVACDPTPERFAMFLAVSTLGAVVLTAFLVLVGSLTFHFGGQGEQQSIGFEAITLFSFYPVDMFGGVSKFLLYTVLPGAFITGIPAKLIDRFEFAHLLWLMSAALVFVTLARAVFTSGLRRYRSGSSWTVA